MAILNFNQYISEGSGSGSDIEDIKKLLDGNVYDLDGIELIGSGFFGKAYIVTTHDNDIRVVKVTKSLPEYWLANILLKKQYFDYVAEIYETFELNSKWVIVKEYLSVDNAPSKEIQDLLHRYHAGFISKERAMGKLDKSERYEFEMMCDITLGLKNQLGIEDIDTSPDNWGYDENMKLKLIEVDGNIRKPDYEKFMR